MPDDHGHQRPQPRHRGAEADEGVHGGGAVPKIGEGGLVEAASAPEHDDGGQQQRKPLPPGDLQGRHHRDRDHGGRQRECQLHPRQEHVGAFLPGFDGGLAGPVAGSLHHGDQVLSGGALRGLHPGLFGGVVDGGLHPVDLVELLLDAIGAGGAGHARQVEGDRHRVLGAPGGAPLHHTSTGHLPLTS